MSAQVSCSGPEGEGTNRETADFTLLVVEDDADDQLLICRAFRDNNVRCSIQCVSSGNAAIAYLSGHEPYSDRVRFPNPSFIMTGLRMPCGDGLSVLEHLRSHLEWRIIPTIVFSSSAAPCDVNESYRLGASGYVVKPGTIDELRRFLRFFHDFWMLCEVPQVDASGKWVKPEAQSKFAGIFGESGG